MAIELTLVKNNPTYIDVYVRKKETEYKKRFGILMDDGRFYFHNDIEDIVIGCVSTLLSLNLVRHMYRVSQLGEAHELNMDSILKDATAYPYTKQSLKKYDIKQSKN
jgi:hypothetical protein